MTLIGGECCQNGRATGADILDINCGRPSPKVTGGGDGSALLKDLCKMEALIKAVIAAVQIPVTLKYRAGWDDDSLNYLDTAGMRRSRRRRTLRIASRTRAQLQTGTADWSRVREVREVVKIPVLGSGRCQRCRRSATPPRGRTTPVAS
jgi:tRNA-dihydrouridine synthase